MAESTSVVRTEHGRPGLRKRTAVVSRRTVERPPTSPRGNRNKSPPTTTAARGIATAVRRRRGRWHRSRRRTELGRQKLSSRDTNVHAHYGTNRTSCAEHARTCPEHGVSSSTRARVSADFTDGGFVRSDGCYRRVLRVARNLRVLHVLDKS